MSDRNKIISKIKDKQKEQADIIPLYLTLLSENNLLLSDFFTHINRKLSLIKDYVWLCKMKHKEINSGELSRCNQTLVANIYNNFGSWGEFKECVELYKKDLGKA